MHSIADAVEELRLVDPPADAVTGLIRRLLPAGPVKDLLSGTWLGHALHPLLTDLPIGFWTSAWVLDLVGGRSSAPAARKLVGLGVLSALPTAAAGAADWSDTTERDRRVGFVHAAANTVALASYTMSYVERRRDRRGRGILWGWVGAAAATAGGYLGGHLIAALGVGVDNTTFDEGPADWTTTSSGPPQPDRASVYRAGNVDVAVTSFEGGLAGLADRCNHRGGPLHEGEVDGSCLVCPWHGSAFRLADGEVERGPAVLPQPAYEAREVGRTVEIRRRPRKVRG